MSQSHTATQQWQTFEMRMRQRRAERCALRGSVALDAGFPADARLALEEAQQLAPEDPLVLELAAKISAAELAAAARPEPATSPLRWVAVAAMLILLSMSGGWLWVRAGVDDRLRLAQRSAPAPQPAPSLSVTAAPAPAAAPREDATVAVVQTPVQVEETQEAPEATATTGDSAPGVAAPSAPQAEAAGPRDEAPTPARPEPAPRVEPPAARTEPPPPAPRPSPPIETRTAPAAETRAAARPASAPALPAAGTAPPPVPTPERVQTELPVQADSTLASALPAGSPAAVPPPPVAAPRASASPPPAAAAPEPPGAGAVAPAAVPPDRLVRAALGRYETAYSRLDANAAGAVWPSVDRRALARAFDGLSAQRIDLGSCEVRVNGPSAQADCAGRASWTPKVGSGTQTASRRWRFDLKSDRGEWVIVQATVR